MTELKIPNKASRIADSPSWWENFFYTYEDWDTVNRILDEEWDAKIIFSEKGLVAHLVFETGCDLTRFLLRWS